MLRAAVAASCASAILSGCAGTPRDDGRSLVYPPSLSVEQRRSNVAECYRSAIDDAQAKSPLTAAEKAPLQGRSTLKFFHRGRPVANSEWAPSMMTTLSGFLGEQGNHEATDRYVLCFLARGYAWPNPPEAR